MLLLDVNILVYAQRDIRDAYLAALAIDNNCEFVSTDGGFARFPGLKWRKPF